MKNKFAVKVHNKYLSEAVQKLAFDNGYKWYNSGANAINTDEEIIYLNDTKLIECSPLNYFNAHHSSEYPLYSALTDWDKIEQAMKPKEPMVIWVNLYEGQESVGGNNVWLSYEQARAGMSDKTKTIKFREVIE